jgi:two-component system nitrogen regulation response regulator GlnG
MLPKRLFALVVSNEDDNCFQELKGVLKKQRIEIYSAESCEEVARLLDQTHPELVFTAKFLDDGTWRDVVRLAESVAVPTNVILVGQNDDVRLYISAMDYGAFDFILPPFEEDAIAHVVRVASDSVHRRRESLATTAVA